MQTNAHSGTRIHEVAAGIYRINTPLDLPNGGAFSFNQYLIVDESPLLFHTGARRLFPFVREAVATVIDPSTLRYVSFSHVESDESGSLNDWLALAPNASPVCSTVAAMVSVQDLADREPIALPDGGTLSLGQRTVRWLDAPHLPHGWENGFLYEETTATLFNGDLFTQPGRGDDPLVESDILGPSEAFRAQMNYYSGTRNARPLIEKLAATNARTLACMHGSAWHGDAGTLIRALGDSLGA